MRTMFRCVCAAVCLFLAGSGVMAQAPGQPAPAAGSPATATTPPASGQTTPPPAIDSGDTAWMLTSSALVLMMTAPGLALFYGGLVRKKNILGVMMQCMFLAGMLSVVWALWGYSLAFDEDMPGLHGFVGGFGNVAMKGVMSYWDSSANKAVVPASPLAPNIPSMVFLAYQGMFFIITPALICGAFAERMKFSTMCVFMLLWGTLIYCPLAHWVWSSKGIFADGPHKAFDFAGGTVVHVSSGTSALVCALVLGKRLGYGQEPMPPHNLTYTCIGAGLLWVGWFGFNAGSNLEANGTTSLAFVNTMVATAGAAFSWLVCEWIVKGKPSLLGICSGAVAGLVAVTPASGFAGPIGALVLGLLVSPVCLFFVSAVKNTFGYDDALDVFGVHCIGGIIGALGTGILVNPALGGVGITDYANITGNNAGTYDLVTQMIAQGKAVLATLIWSGVGSAILYKIVDLVIGLRPTVEEEREGLDIVDHGERAYNM
jgi:Amt family ammonium transporter